MKWYAIFVETGYEEKIKDYILKLESHKDTGITFELLIPKRKLYERKKGIWKVVFKTLFPGYILIKTDQIDKFYMAVKESPHIVKFLKTGLYFMEINENEISFLRQMIDDMGIVTISSACCDEKGLVILSGPLKGMEAAVHKVDKRKGRAKVKFIINGQTMFMDVGIKICPSDKEIMRTNGNLGV